jgi:hypothetical protein
MRIGAAQEQEAEAQLNRGSGGDVALNPQPEPPGVVIPGDTVALNPQPDPPADPLREPLDSSLRD